MKTARILMAGAGGQGIVFLGKLLANAAIESTPHITFFPSYGAEVRGGDSHCQVILSSSVISSPVADEFDAMILMNQQSVEKFLPSLADKGLAIINSSLCRARQPSPSWFMMPATEEADQLGDQRAANLVMLGALLARRPFVKAGSIQKNLLKALKGDRSTLERNLAAFNSGLIIADEQ